MQVDKEILFSIFRMMLFISILSTRLQKLSDVLKKYFNKY